jgi:hypothetical protein
MSSHAYVHAAITSVHDEYLQEAIDQSNEGKVERERTNIQQYTVDSINCYHQIDQIYSKIDAYTVGDKSCHISSNADINEGNHDIHIHVDGNVEGDGSIHEDEEEESSSHQHVDVYSLGQVADHYLKPDLDDVLITQSVSFDFWLV